MNKLKLELYIHLHVHTEYSNIRLLDSTNKITKMLKYVASLGQKGLAITDHEALSGHVKFIQEVKKLKKEGVLPSDFKPILGNEIYLVNETQMNEGLEMGSGVKFNHFLLLAKDKIGHEQLRELSSRAWKRMFNYKGMERVPTFYSDIENIVGKNKGHIIASSACLGSFLGQKVLELLNTDIEEDKIQIKTEIHEFVCWCVDIFGDDFYIEIQPSQMEEQIEFNKMAIKIANGYKIKYIVTTDSHYLTSEDREVHKAYLTSDEEGGSNREVDDFYSSTHFFTEDMLREYLGYLSEEELNNSISNTYEIANKIEEYDLNHKQIIPKVKLPNQEEWFFDLELFNIAQKYENIKTMLNSEEQYDRYLVNISLKGLRDKINNGFITKDDYNETFERINTECYEIIGSSKAKDEPLSSYFVTMAKNIDIIWDDAESIVAVGRGSAGGYIINYLVGITQINPLKQGIEMPHWRFISAERPDLIKSVA